MFKKDFQEILNSKEIITKDQMIKLTEIISDQKNIQISQINFSNKGPQIICGKNILTLSNNPEAAWFVKDIYEFKNAVDLNYIDNNDLIKNLNIIYENLPVKFINNLFTMTIIHELRHAEHFKIIEETYMYNDPVLVKNLLLSYQNTSPTFISLYHDKVYYEFEATIQAILELLKYEIDPKIKRYFAYKILLAYTNKPGKEFSSPLENNKNSNGDKFESNYYFRQVDYINENIYCPKEDIRLGTKIKQLQQIDDYYQGRR